MKRKFMMSLNQPNYGLLAREAKQRGISLQELIRVVVIPRWLHDTQGVAIDLDALRRFIHRKGLNGKPCNQRSKKKVTVS